MKPILVINSGSSSLKYQLIDTDSGQSLDAGLIERVTDHAVAFQEMLGKLGGPRPIAVGHRVVHGGSKFSKATLVDASVLTEIDSLVPLAPLHNPGNADAFETVEALAAGIATLPDPGDPYYFYGKRADLGELLRTR